MESTPLRLRHGFTSPLRYPGGKGMLANFMKLVIARNGLLDGHYVEVYAGGAGVVWSLLLAEYVQHVHVNDIDRALYAFWTSVLEETDELSRLIRDTKISMPVWRRQRQILNRPTEHSTVQLGFATFFLNRTNRSGIIGGGVIGGQRQTGTWKLDARFNKRDLITRIEKIARYRRRISLSRLDAADFLRQVVPTLPPKTLLYLDPPYYVKGGGLYEHHYHHHDHVLIAGMVKQLEKPAWVVSYDAAPEILRLYRGFRRQEYDLAYSAQERYAGTEVMFFGPQLRVPIVDNPAKVRLG
jgi:DNA adenine methylase